METEPAGARPDSRGDRKLFGARVDELFPAPLVLLPSCASRDRHTADSCLYLRCQKQQAAGGESLIWGHVRFLSVSCRNGASFHDAFALVLQRQ